MSSVVSVMLCSTTYNAVRKEEGGRGRGKEREKRERDAKRERERERERERDAKSCMPPRLCVCEREPDGSDLSQHRRLMKSAKTERG